MVASDDQALLERRDAITDAVEKQAVRKLKRVLADEENEVLDRLRRNPKVSASTTSFRTAGEHAERTRPSFEPHLVEVAQTGGGFYGDKPANTDVDDLAGRAGSGTDTPAYGIGIDGSLRKRPATRKRMADGVRAVYRDWKTHRVESQARDTVIAAFNRGLFDGNRSAERGCAGSSTTADLPAPTPRTTRLPGRSSKGEPFPTGHCYPPAHPGCRCLLVPESQ